MSLKDIATWPPEKIDRAEWRIVANTLKRAQEMLEERGTRQSWIDPVLAICAERGKEPEQDTLLAGA